ncbi:murein hydrolase activator EnvC family protein [Streptomyces spectabilis]|uniref:M23 family metallopeptidase n=1 Tax=Streptomyces spectabilis TaxID=68270 RepID=A0A516R9P9_STRST|nr:M23 family metallopeptidase [Streptomyces spectabilis]QDQ12389.1 M23 family metallopeptidase [Streptomyces spectabilis]
MSIRKLAAVLRRFLWLVFFAQATAGFFVDLPYNYWLGWLPAVAAICLGLLLGRKARQQMVSDPPAPVEVEAPVTGRWSALNSPADKVPSHGTHGLGQTYAIDITAEGDESGEHARPGFSWLWPVARRGRDYPAFGAPLLAVADATVVHAEDGQRDHLSRTSLVGLLYFFFVEGTVRGAAPARRVVGNHVILDLGGGIHAAYAHVRRGSLTVRVGDRVRAGQVVGQCGNSGNSTEPHVHFQLMDGPDIDTARGVPFRWRGVGVPANGEVFTVAPEGAPAASESLTQ